MALGGGTFVTKNKVLPGVYINFVSLNRAAAVLSDRGTVAMGLSLDWGEDDKVVKVAWGDFVKKSERYFGYAFGHESMKGLRDLFLNANTLLFYRLNGGGVKAENDFATAKYTGTRGNDIQIAIKENVNNSSEFDVETIIDLKVVDTQTVEDATKLKSNDWVDFKSSATLQVTAATPLTGGTNGTASGASHQSFLEKLEVHAYNTLGLVSTDDATKSLYISYIKNIRENVGTKAQLVLHDKAADYEGVVNVKNTTTEGNAQLVYWVTGLVAGTAVNKSALNKKYDGEYSVNAEYTQAQLKQAVINGQFVLHFVGDDLRVLKDINSLTSFTEEKGEQFKYNQTVRVADQIANDIAKLFATKYIGVIPNDESGRISLWADIVKHHEQLQQIRAIQGFVGEDVKVEEGDNPDAVIVEDKVTINRKMAQLYMRVVIA